jgi:hypothetical protein
MDFSGPSVILQGDLMKAAAEKMVQYTKRSIPENARIYHRYMKKTDIISLNEMINYEVE